MASRLCDDYTRCEGVVGRSAPALPQLKLSWHHLPLESSKFDGAAANAP
jgi:hypothetical protein